MLPKIVIVAHTNPAGPLFPKANVCAVAEPIKDVKAAISMKPFPMLNDAKAGSVEVALWLELWLVLGMPVKRP
jgi:hypothetical protein